MTTDFTNPRGLDDIENLAFLNTGREDLLEYVS
jgi:hypothetical protein